MLGAVVLMTTGVVCLLLAAMDVLALLGVRDVFRHVHLPGGMHDSSDDWYDDYDDVQGDYAHLA